MSRASNVYYIAPSSISIVPNANGSADDLAVYIDRGAKIKIYYPPIYDLGTTNAKYQEWTMAGYNRRLADSEKPYTVYARLRKVPASASPAEAMAAHADGYLVFAPRVKRNDKWTDPYVLSPNTSSTNTMFSQGADGKAYEWAPIPSEQTQEGRSAYWWVRLGTVSEPKDGVRSVDIDTGILGTDQFNNEWQIVAGELQEDVASARKSLSDFLSRVDDDKAKGVIGFLKGLWVKAEGLFGIDGEGNGRFNSIDFAGVLSGLKAVIDSIMSKNFSGDGTSGSGWQITDDDGNGESQIIADNVYSRKKGIFNNIGFSGILSGLRAVINNIESGNYDGDGTSGSGWQLTNDDGTGNSRLVVD
ncbi:MAG: hypothetical protein J6M41_09155, partial [Prevotella sp.]|nr:hypothetical protein [Prevotella sp.]